MSSGRARSATALPREAGRPRVQRLVNELRPVHLEAAIPTRAAWRVTIDGYVEQPLALSLAELVRLGTSHAEIDFHCVWGWSRPRCRWRGVRGADLIESSRPLANVCCAVLSAADSPYASCVRLPDIADGMLAVALDGRPLTAEHGGPVRFVPPARLWAYKGVKWLERVTFVNSFEAGFWEAKVGDVEGRVPHGILELMEHHHAEREVSTRGTEAGSATANRVNRAGREE